MAPTSQISLGPDVTVDALLDTVADHPRRLQDAFAGTPDGGWEAAIAAHPATAGREGRWRLTVHAYFVRAHGTTVLVDAGVGPATTVAAEWLGVTGSLPSRLAAVGSEPAAVDLVVFTHLHEDYVGGAADPGTDAPAFVRALYVVGKREWAVEQAHGVLRHVDEGLGPAQRRGRLETPPPGELAQGSRSSRCPGTRAGTAECSSPAASERCSWPATRSTPPCRCARRRSRPAPTPTPTGDADAARRAPAAGVRHRARRKRADARRVVAGPAQGRGPGVGRRRVTDTSGHD